MSAPACAPTPHGTTLTFAEPTMHPSPAEPEVRGGGANANKPERCVHPQLWQACAGSLCALPPVGAAVYYFPQGHAEQATGGAADVDLGALRVPPFVPCRVADVRLMVEPDTADVFAKMRLVPLRPGEPLADVGGAGDGKPQPTTTVSTVKALTQSDANSSTGFSAPRIWARTIFPELDYSSDSPRQTVSARDAHGVEWRFCHVFRGTPRRHLLTSGWRTFVSSKKLLAGDSVVFVRDEDGTVHVGLRRGKRVFGGDDGSAAAAGPSDGKVPAEDVVAAARHAGAGEPFEVVYYPRASAPLFCVRAAAVKQSMQEAWRPGQRFKMAFETGDVSRISWFEGTVARVAVADPARWPQSPWRLLQVTWDEPELLLLRKVNRVCPWQVEQVSTIPTPTLPLISLPQRKKPRTESDSGCRQLFDLAFPTNHPLPLPLPLAHPNHDRKRDGFVPSFPFPFPDRNPAAAGIQGARHHPPFAPFFSDPHLSSLQQSLLFHGIRPGGVGDQQAASPAPRIDTDMRLSIGSLTPRSPSPGPKKDGDGKPPPGMMLFGRAILTEEQMKSNNGSSVPTPLLRATRSFGSSNPDCDDEKASNTSDRSGSDGSGTHGRNHAKDNSPSLRLWWPGDSPASQFVLEPGQCKAFVESDAVGRNLDLSALGSFQELRTHLSNMFGIDNDADLRSHLLYRTIAGEVKHVGDEPFSAFAKSARRITILSDAGSDNAGNP